MRKRSTFRVTKPASAVNLHLFARRAAHETYMREQRQRKALKRPGAKAAADVRIEQAKSIRERKAAKRAANYLAGLAGYHPVIRYNQASV